MKIGCHLSTSKGFEKAVAKAQELGADAFQFFPKNPKSYRPKAIDVELCRRGADAARAAGIQSVAHSPYVTNLSTSDPSLRQLTVASIVNDLEICEAVGADYLVVHCGKHVGQGEVEGRMLMADTADEIMTQYKGPVWLLLENTAGQGSELGQSVDELLAIHQQIQVSNQVGFCFDTCHAFAAGWLSLPDWDEFVEAIGHGEFLQLLKMIHLNDSKTGFGEHRDRHEKLGRGQMGAELLRQFVGHPAFEHLPFLIETPVDDEDEYAEEIRIAKGWAGTLRAQNVI